MFLFLLLQLEEDIVEDIQYCLFNSLTLQEAFQTIVFSLASSQLSHKPLNSHLLAVELSRVEA